MDPKIYVALDCEAKQVDELIKQLNPKLCGIKIGKELFTYLGPDIVRKCSDAGFKIFLDLKFHDIPNTVAKACKAATELNVNMLTIHATGGSEMIRKAKEQLQKSNNPPYLLAVTVLTSINEDNLKELGFDTTTKEQALRLAKMAIASGADGVVCSANEAKDIRKLLGNKPKIITPGIRLRANNSDDQKRVATPEEAIRNGSDYLVVGRPITNANAPGIVLEEISQRILTVNKTC